MAKLWPRNAFFVASCKPSIVLRLGSHDPDASQKVITGRFPKRSAASSTVTAPSRKRVAAPAVMTAAASAVPAIRAGDDARAPGEPRPAVTAPQAEGAAGAGEHARGLIPAALRRLGAGHDFAGRDRQPRCGGGAAARDGAALGLLRLPLWDEDEGLLERREHRRAFRPELDSPSPRPLHADPARPAAG